ncbi:gamma-glutamyltransferase [Nannocystis pusilla]|uniref:Gamma-glutamyltransferase n=1 Tax=Nannocystis pusilla TaxID=889268 RepID=A0A9X3IW24_9BACT|nr:gamma-glutamyltransferase [Nannocystis pusilla]MCY1005470.1 gamma-glutamyltransferase [Nannocystis pusilla]
MTCSDLANYQLGVFDPDLANSDPVHAPVIGSYHGHTIVTAPPPSSGVFLVQMLDLLERLEARWGFSIGAGNYEFGEVGTLNVMQEVMRAAFADRARWLGDPDFFPVPVAGLLAPSYIQTRAGLITPGQRRSSFSAGSPPTLAAAQQKPASTKETQEHEGVDTTHFTVIDEAGNVVSVTSTISDLWGTGLMVRGRGFMLNNQLPNFNDDPQGTAANPAANDVEGGKSPRTTIAPTLVFLGDELVAGYGSPGGTGIINAILQVTLNLVDHDLTLSTAVQRPRISLDSGSSSARHGDRVGLQRVGALELAEHGLRLRLDELDRGGAGHRHLPGRRSAVRGRRFAPDRRRQRPRPALTGERAAARQGSRRRSPRPPRP